MTRPRKSTGPDSHCHLTARALCRSTFALLVLGSGMTVQTVSAAAEARFDVEPFETRADSYRVREGHFADADDRTRDAEVAAAGRVVGATPAFDAAVQTFLTARALPDGSHDPLQTRSNDHGQYDDTWYGDTWIADLGTLLRGDRDGDGFFGAVEFTIDADSDAVSQDVYAVIELIDADNILTVRHETATFTLYGRASSDAYRIEIELLQNHAAGWRDGRVELRDAFDGSLLDEVTAYTHATLAALPLESEADDFPRDDDWDDSDVDTHHPGGYAGGFTLTGSAHGESVVHGEDTYVAGYAAASTPLSLLALFGLALGRLAARRHRHDSL